MRLTRLFREWLHGYIATLLKEKLCNNLTMKQYNNFSSAPPTIMHIDLNSCFASVEQQANPLLRGKPVAVAAYVQSNGCILAASREAKKLGIKTSMRVWEGKQIFPNLIVLPPDPEKYRFVNRKLVELLSSYTPNFSVESIDEIVLKMPNDKCQMTNTAREIKQRIKEEIGEWLTVSIGIAPNRYLAKVASGLHKPDGFDVITKENIEEVLGKLELVDLCGIKEGNSLRLRSAGIKTPLDFYRASPVALKRAFRAVTGYLWWLRLHGYPSWEIEAEQKSFGQSYALGKPYLPTQNELHKILAQLVAKMGKRLRDGGFVASGVRASCLFADHTYWNHGEKSTTAFYADADFYKRAKAILMTAPAKPVRILAISSFNLQKSLYQQESLFVEERRKRLLTQAIDQIADRWGDGTIVSGRVLGTAQQILDRIAFAGVK